MTVYETIKKNMVIRMVFRRITRFVRNHKKLLSIAGAVIISSYFLFSFIFSELGFSKYMYMRREYHGLTENISHLEKENKKLRHEVDALKTDPDYIEALAREKLGLVKKGEIIYQFEDKGKGK